MAEFDTAAAQQKFSRPKPPHKMRGRMKLAHGSGDEGSQPFCRDSQEIGSKVNAQTSHEMSKRFTKRKHR